MLNGAVPSFALDQGGLLLVLVRGFAVLGMLALFGTLVFRSLVSPFAWRRADPVEAAALDFWLTRLALLELAWGAMWLVVWVPVQAATMVGARSLGAAARVLPTVMPTVMLDTRFGHLVSLQVLILLAAGVALRWRRGRAVATGLGGMALALQSGHGHAFAMQPGPSLLLVCDIVHLLAAGAWLGGLIPLLIVVVRAPCRIGAAACRYFSPLGKGCVVAVLATAVVQFWQLVGGLPGLVGTAYGWVAGAKMGLFAVLFGFALVNRYRLAPALLGAAPEPSRRRLARSIAVQSVAGLAVVVAAAMLSQLSPAMHIQAVWPFTWQPSLMIVNEDAEFRDEVARALLALGGAMVIFALAVVLRRRRWFAGLACVVGGGLVALAVPHLDLLFVPATPTGFYHSPNRFATGSIVAGAALYPANCASCHGAEGRGDGAQAAGLAVPPADLTAPHLWDHADGQLFWWISHGMEAPRGGLAMPGFAGTLSEDDIWALIDFIRAHNAGVAHATGGAWPVPVPAPSFEMRCGEAEARDLAEFRGRVVRLVFGPVGAPAGAQAGGGMVTASTAPAPTRPGVCTTDDETIGGAYAIVAGVSPGALAGNEVLIDGQGWLREVHPLGDTAEEAAWLAAAVRSITEHPLAAAATVGMAGMDHPP